MLAVLTHTLIGLSLLPVFIGGSSIQQDQLCADSYAEFERSSVGSNVSGDNLRSLLYETFYAPNQRLPFSVLVTYQLVLDNGTRFNLSSDQSCSTELWVWLSSAVFLSTISGDPYTYFFRFCTLDFSEWDKPHVTITTTVPPCSDKILNFLSEMTASVS